MQKSLAGYENKDCTADELLQLSGALQDAVRVNYDIVNFLKKKERMKKFESAVGDGLDKNERDMLVKTLSGKLNSLKY